MLESKISPAFIQQASKNWYARNNIFSLGWGGPHMRDPKHERFNQAAHVEWFMSLLDLIDHVQCPNVIRKGSLVTCQHSKGTFSIDLKSCILSPEQSKMLDQEFQILELL